MLSGWKSGFCMQREVPVYSQKVYSWDEHWGLIGGDLRADPLLDTVVLPEGCGRPAAHLYWGTAIAECTAKSCGIYP